MRDFAEAFFQREGDTIMVPAWLRDGLKAYLDEGGPMDRPLALAVTCAMEDVYIDALRQAIEEQL